MDEATLERYQVYFKDADSDTIWSAFYMADDFAHAEEQAIDGSENHPDSIILIRKGDYMVNL